MLARQLFMSDNANERLIKSFKIKELKLPFEVCLRVSFFAHCFDSRKISTQYLH